MRRSGLDEYKVARTFAVVVDKLSDGKTAKDTEECKSSSSTSSKNAAATSTRRNPSAPPPPPPRKSLWFTTSRAHFARNRSSN